MPYRPAFDLSVLPEAKPIFRVSVIAAAIGALAIVAVTIVDAKFMDIAGLHDTQKLMEALPLVFVVAMVLGALANFIALMILGLPIAKLMGNKLAGLKGTAISLISAALGCFAFYALAAQQPFSGDFDAILLGITACFALPAALLYRRSLIIARGFSSN